MAETLTIRTASSTEIVKIAVPGPQGPAGQGVPVGGSTGQVLRKASGSDYDTEWAAAGSGSGSVTSVALASTDLTISGSPITDSGTITANIAVNAVTLEKLQTISSEHLLGRHGSGNGGVQQIGLGTGLAISGSNVRVATTGITAGTYTKLTVDETGRATVGATATPSDIGAQSAQVTETLSLSASVTLTASRNKLWKISNNTFSDYFVELPTANISVGDIVEIEYTSSTGRALAIRRDGVALGLSLPNETRARYRADTANADGWVAVTNNYSLTGSIYISAGDVLLGRQDVAGQVQQIPCTAAGRALLDDADAAAQRTTLGLGTAAVEAASAFAQASHTHELTALAATGATNGHVLTANGSNGVTFAALPASGVTGAAASASDVLGVSGANITGVDAGAADRLVFWDDSASKLTYLEAGSGLSISGTTLTASGGLNAMQSIAINFVLN